MFSKSPDSAARAFIYSSVLWLLIGATCFFVAMWKLASPETLAGRYLSYPRLTAAASMSLQYGWLGLSSIAAMFYVLPRVTGTRMHSEGAGQFAVTLLNVALLLGLMINLGAGPQGDPFAELPGYLFVVVVIALAGVAANVLRTIARRDERDLYVSAWFFGAAAVWAPLAIIAGRLIPLTGLSASIADQFSTSSVLNLWFAACGLGALYYVIPRATGRPLYSHTLAMTGFWTLAVFGPMTGEARRVFGPTQDWLQTVAAAASIGLLVAVVTVLVNVFGTLSGGWDKVPSHPSVRFMVGGSVFWAAAMGLGALTSFRSVNRAVGLTDWIPAQIWTLVLGAFTLWSAGLITYAIPRLMGRRWSRSVMVTAHFWTSTLGLGIMLAGLLGAGAVTAAALNAGVSAAEPLSAGGGYSVVLSSVSRFRWMTAFGAGIHLIGQWVFAINLLRSTTSGEPRPIEVVVPAELVA